MVVQIGCYGNRVVPTVEYSTVHHITEWLICLVYDMESEIEYADRSVSLHPILDWLYGTVMNSTLLYSTLHNFTVDWLADQLLTDRESEIELGDFTWYSTDLYRTLNTLLPYSTLYTVNFLYLARLQPADWPVLWLTGDWNRTDCFHCLFTTLFSAKLTYSSVL